MSIVSYVHSKVFAIKQARLVALSGLFGCAFAALSAKGMTGVVRGLTLAGIYS
jgi:hypothetical protein